MKLNKKINNIIFLLCGLIFHAQSTKELSQEQKDYITKFIYPLQSFDPNFTDNSDLKILDKLIGNAKIVGLGESTHGSSEIYKMKNRISRYLISNSDFNIFSLEANMPESFRMNNYITEKKDNPKDLLEGMYFWLWQTKETLDFIDWLKNYNDAYNSRIIFDGFDMQFASGALNQIRDIYTQNNINVDEINELEKILKDENRGQRSYTAKSQKTIGNLLVKMKQKNVSFKSPEDKARYLQNIRIIEQKIQINSIVKRDQFMAENINWIMENNKNPKLILSAHNYHISKLNSERMGYYVNEEFKNDYVNFGFAFYEGTYSASVDRKIGTFEAETAPPESLEYYLNYLNKPIFIIDLKSIKKENNPLAKWILKDILFRKTGSGTDKNKKSFKSTNVSNSFDYLIFINESSNSNLLKQYN